MAGQKGSRLIISGGGTGGHVFPAIAIADAVGELAPDVEILFVGAKGKIEMEKIPKAGYPIEGLWISGFHRKLTFRNLLFPLKVVSSLWKAWRIIRRFRPDVVVGVGGFASGPVVEVASRMGIPTLIQEQNSYAGLTNRILAGKVDTICVAYEGMEKYFPKEKLVLTGNPVRKDLTGGKLDKAAARKHFGMLPEKKTIFVFGGSLGAQSINEAMAANAKLIKENQQIQVLWQVGKLYYERFKDCETARLPNVGLQVFIDRMDLAYVLADLVICRAGAMTVSEISQVGKPAIFIPSPNVAEDHQTKNALAMVEKEAAVIVKDTKAGSEIMKKALELLSSEEILAHLRENVSLLAKPDAAFRIAEQALKLIKER